jgi:hypothetical protein
MRPAWAIVARIALGAAIGACSAAAQSARLVELSPHSLAVGDELTLRIRVEHAPNERIAFLQLADALGVGWAELDQRLRRLPTESAAGAEPRRLEASELTLVLAPLESGTLELPRLYVELARAGAGAAGEPFALPVECATELLHVEVAAALGADEDDPRELRPLRELDPVVDARFVPWWSAAGAAVLASGGAAVGWMLRAARARERRRVQVVNCFERLAALEARAAEAESAPFAHELAAVLRQAVSELCPALRVRRSGVARAALTDEEYVDALDPTAPERERLAALLMRLRAVRYGGAVPTAWARGEWLTEAKELLEALRLRGTQARPVEPQLSEEALA